MIYMSLWGEGRSSEAQPEQKSRISLEPKWGVCDVSVILPNTRRGRVREKFFTLLVIPSPPLLLKPGLVYHGK